MKMSKKNKREFILIIFSFFIGLLVGVAFLSLFVPKEKKKRNYLKDVSKAIVSIETYNGSIIESTGTGFFYKEVSNKAYILTNEHVIGEDIVVINDNGEECDAKVLGKDSKLDIAVLQTNKKCSLKSLKIGNNKDILIGDTIYAVGTPIARDYQGTITKGIISGLHRTVPVSTDAEDEWLMDAIQFDASVNPGNSGGPLLNENGEVIGICTMKLIKEEIEGMGFAIPIDIATSSIKQLEKGKQIEYPELGIAMVNISNTAELNNNNIEMPKERINGVVVLDVKENSNASNKLIKGDIITEIDDVTIKDTSQVKYILFTHKKGDKIEINIIRNKKEKKINIELN